MGRLEQIANSMVEASSSHNNSVLRKIREDVVDLYERQTFRPSSLHQRQILHADNSITFIRDIYRVFIDKICSHCPVINNA